jgi:hypothetical protein
MEWKYMIYEEHASQLLRWTGYGGNIKYVQNFDGKFLEDVDDLLYLQCTIVYF